MAWAYAHARAAFIGWTMGVNHSTKGTETVNAINNLALITGNIGRSGASPFSITGQCNAMGTREAGFTLEPARAIASSRVPRIGRSWRRSGTFPSTAFRRRVVSPIPTSSRRCSTGRIRALWIIATNPIVSFPNYGALKQALEGLDFLVVQDGYQPTPTSEFAHLMLPAAIWGEKEGTYTNSERRVSRANKAVNPPGEAWSDFDIFLGLADVLGVRQELFPAWTKPADAFEEWKKVSAGRLCDYSGITYRLIEQHGGVQWPFPAGATQPEVPRRLYEDGVFETDDGRAKLLPTAWEPFPEQPTEQFPFVLNTGRTVEHWHTRTKTGKVPILERLSPTAWVEMNPRDARALRLKPKDRVDVVSRRGRVHGVELRVTETVAPGQLFVPFHYAEQNANQMTQSAFDPHSREPNYKQSAVRVEATTREAGGGLRRSGFKLRGARSAGTAAAGAGAAVRPSPAREPSCHTTPDPRRATAARRCAPVEVLDEASRGGRQWHGRHGLRRTDSEVRAAVPDHRLR